MPRDKKKYDKEYNKQWYQNNKEYKKEQSKEYYQNNKEHKKEYFKEYFKTEQGIKSMTNNSPNFSCAMIMV